MRSIKVGILGSNFIDWAGGRDFLRNTIDTLLVNEDLQLRVVLILPIKGGKAMVHSLARTAKHIILGRNRQNFGLPVIKDSILGSDGKNVEVLEIDRGERALQRACISEGIDILIPVANPLDKSFPIPWVGWIADFQHKHNPTLFSRKEIAFRDQHFSNMLERAPTVIVNSKTVANEIAGFYRGSSVIFSMPFNPGIPSNKITSEQEVRRKYSIDGAFILCSNQFWLHKDHPTLFEAFAQLNKTISNLQLVCTGDVWDPRDKSYGQKIFQLIESLKISSKTKILGLIPKQDQLGLMRCCEAVVQPSTSEGGPGGGAVFDALGLGVRCVISDIDVNQEIEDDLVHFFRVSNPTSLKEKILAVIETPKLIVSEEKILEQNQHRRRLCSRELTKVLVKTLS